jgi:hypothetical protein
MVQRREAGLLGPLAEPACCHPPNFSTQRARRDGERRGWSAGGRERSRGGRGGSGSRWVGSAHASCGRAQPLAPRGRRCCFFSPARGRVSHGHAPSRRPRPARPGPARPRALDPGLSPLCAGAPRGSRFGGLGLELLAGALETPEPPLRTQACMQGSFNLAFTRSPRTVLWASGASKKPEAGL